MISLYFPILSNVQIFFMTFLNQAHVNYSSISSMLTDSKNQIFIQSIKVEILLTISATTFY